jgi:hypothetical protein
MMAGEGAKKFSHVSSNKFAALLPCRSHRTSPDVSQSLVLVSVWRRAESSMATACRREAFGGYWDKLERPLWRHLRSSCRLCAVWLVSGFGAERDFPNPFPACSTVASELKSSLNARLSC